MGVGGVFWGALLSCNFLAHRSVRAGARADLIWKHNFLSPPPAAAKVIALNQLFIPQTMEAVVGAGRGRQGEGWVREGSAGTRLRRFYIRPSVPNSP